MPRKMIDLMGQKFGKLTVVELLIISNQGKNGNKQQTTWKCLCECGNYHNVTTSNLRAGQVRSCGCLPSIGKTGKQSVTWRGGRHIRKSGYVYVTVSDYPNHNKNLTISEHAYVMAKNLNRPLYKNENVHHINGDRTDNRIENLELWSHSQPYGQRIEDKINWAIEILQTYKPELIKI